jgi:hypothetical protein
MLLGLRKLLIVDQPELTRDLAKAQPLALRGLHLETVTGRLAGQVAQFDGYLSKQPILGTHDDPYAVLAGFRAEAEANTSLGTATLPLN